MNKKPKTVPKKDSPTTPDRRVHRTRQVLQKALITLILHKGYEAITVQDILDQANVGRSTFYNHYWDKEDLLLGMFEDFRASMEAYRQAQGPAHAENLSLGLFQYAEGHHRLYKAMVGKHSGKVVLSYVQKYLADYIREHLDAQTLNQTRAAPPVEIVVQYWVGAFLALLTWWLDNDLPHSAEQMAGMFQQLTMPGLAGVLRFKSA